MIPVKRTIPSLIELVVRVTQNNSAGEVARRLRENGYLSQAGRGRGAAPALSTDAVILLLTLMSYRPAANSAVVANVIRLSRPTSSLRPALARALSLTSKNSSPIDLLGSLVDRFREDDTRLGQEVWVRLDPEAPGSIEIVLTFQGKELSIDFSVPDRGDIMVMSSGVRIATTSGDAPFRTEMPPRLISMIADWFEERIGE